MRQGTHGRKQFGQAFDDNPSKDHGPKPNLARCDRGAGPVRAARKFVHGHDGAGRAGAGDFGQSDPVGAAEQGRGHIGGNGSAKRPGKDISDRKQVGHPGFGRADAKRPQAGCQRVAHVDRRTLFVDTAHIAHPGGDGEDQAGAVAPGGTVFGERAKDALRQFLAAVHRDLPRPVADRGIGVAV